MSENSYLREFSAQVSQIVFLADLTVLPSINFNLYLDNGVNSTSKRQLFSSVYFLAFTSITKVLQLCDLKCQKTHISESSVPKYHKSCF